MDSQWLKRQFECNPNKSKAGLARLLRLEPPAISKILSGTRQIKAQVYNLMRQYFGLAIEGEDTPQTSKNYTIEALAGDTDGSHFLAENEQNAKEESWVIPAGIIEARTQTPPEKIKIFTVKEHFMEPEFKRGENVLIDLSDIRPSPPGCFIISDGFGYMLRACEYVPKSSPATIRVSAFNKAFQAHTLEEDDFKIVGRVIAKLQWL